MFIEVNYSLKRSYVSVYYVTNAEPCPLNKAEKYFLKMKFSRTYSEIFSFYLAVNTHILSYKTKSVDVVQGNNCALFSDPYKHRNTLCGHNVQFLNVQAGGT
jgi:hypothetical protein